MISKKRLRTITLTSDIGNDLGSSSFMMGWERIAGAGTDNEKTD